MSTPTDRLYCWRCEEAVPVIRPWAGWRAALYTWYTTMVLLVFLFPVMASDYCVMIPTMMALIWAGGPLHRFAGEKPVCKQCSAELDPRRKKDGTGVHERRKLKPVGEPGNEP